VKRNTPNTPVEKMAYDGVGRMTRSYETDARNDTTWTDAKSVSDDTIVSQVFYTYDAASNVVLTENRDRFHNATGFGPLEGPTGTNAPARSQYMAYYYDAANRLVDSVNVGSNGGAVYSRPATPPSRSDTALVTTITYDVAGRAYRTTDPKGIIEQKSFDLLGRTTKSIENYIDGIVGNADDVTVEFTYNGVGDRLSVVARMADGTVQQTSYQYGAYIARGDTVNSNRLLVATNHPDKVSGGGSELEQQSQTYNALGERTSLTDENGTVRTFIYDILGRSSADMVTTLGAGVDGAVRRIGTTYNKQGLPEKVSTFTDVSGTTILTQNQRIYDGYGRVT
jgi:hypothetical protein